MSISFSKILQTNFISFTIVYWLEAVQSWSIFRKFNQFDKTKAISASQKDEENFNVEFCEFEFA